MRRPLILEAIFADICALEARKEGSGFWLIDNQVRRSLSGLAWSVQQPKKNGESKLSLLLSLIHI